MQNHIITFKYEDQAHTATYIVETKCDIVENFRLNNKIISITFDNASNNIFAIPYLLGRLKPLLSDIFHIKCTRHVLNLVINDELKQFFLMIEKIKKMNESAYFDLKAVFVSTVQGCF